MSDTNKVPILKFITLKKIYDLAHLYDFPGCIKKTTTSNVLKSYQNLSCKEPHSL